MSFDVEAYERMEEVGDLFLKGMNKREIAVALEMPAREVTEALEQWQIWQQKMMEENKDLAARARQILDEADLSFKQVIKEAWETAQQADNNDELGHKNTALKIVASVQKDRAELMARAGAANNPELIQEMQETKKNQEVILGVLKTISEKYPEIGREILSMLADLDDSVEVIGVEVT